MSAEQGQPIASTSTASIPGAGDEKQIAIRLSTKDPLYTIPPAKFLVPASWRRFHLSELINKVLDTGQSRVAFPPPSAGLSLRGWAGVAAFLVHVCACAPWTCGRVVSDPSLARSCCPECARTSLGEGCHGAESTPSSSHGV